MSNKQQTAVEYLAEQIKQYDFASLEQNDYYILQIPFYVLNEKIKIAIQIEKKQIIDSYDNGHSDGYLTGREMDVLIKHKNSEQYYKQTYWDVK